MKKAVIFVVLAMVVIGSCAAQSANDAQRIVGTWSGVSNSGVAFTYVFNANGTGTTTSDVTRNIYWGICGSGEIYISLESNGNKGSYRKFAMSPDGRRMFIDDYMFQKK